VEAENLMALEVHHRRIGSGDRAVEILDVVGRLDVPGGALLRTTIQDNLKEESSRIAVNFADCREINREMIGTLHSLGRACKRAGGGLVLYGATGDVAEYIKKFVETDLVPWFETENEAVLSLGGEVEQEPGEDNGEPKAVVALGSDKVFKALFWKLGKLGGHPIAKFDNIVTAEGYIGRTKIHSIIIDVSLDEFEILRLIKQVKRTPETRLTGIFLVGPPSGRKEGRYYIEQGGNNFISYVYKGEEIAAKLDATAFFLRLKEAYERYDAGPGGSQG